MSSSAELMSLGAARLPRARRRLTIPGEHSISGPASSGCRTGRGYRHGARCQRGVSKTFSILHLNTTYSLRVNNGGLNAELARSTGSVTLNGVEVVSPKDLDLGVAVLDKPISPLANNQLVVELRGAPGSGIGLQV